MQEVWGRKSTLQQNCQTLKITNIVSKGQVNKIASRDITYCMKTDCEIESCFRNQKHIRDDDFYSFAFLEGTDDCLKVGEQNDSTGSY